MHNRKLSAIAKDAELKELLMKQQKQTKVLQNKVEKQETFHNEALTHYIKNVIDRILESKERSLCIHLTALVKYEYHTRLYDSLHV